MAKSFITFTWLYSSVFLMTLGLGAVSLDQTKLQTLIYDEDTSAKIKYYCEFAPPDDLRPPAFMRICRENNPHMTMIRDGKTLYPWRRYTANKEGIILQCPPHGMNGSSCTDRNRVYSTCTVSCPDGFVNKSETIDCQIKGPLRNVSAEWSEPNPCEKLNKDKSTTEMQGGGSSDSFEIWVIVTVALVGSVLILCALICWHFRNKMCFTKTQSPASTPTGGSRPSLVDGYRQDTTDTSSPSNGDLTDSSILDNQRVGRGAEEGMAELPFGMHNRFYSDGMGEANQSCPREVTAREILDAAPRLSGDGGHEMGDLPRLYKEKKQSACNDESSLALLKDEEEELKSSGKRESNPGSCKALIKEFEFLTLPDFKKMAARLEYCCGRNKGHTLYGYVLAHWRPLGFHDIKEVELYQKREDYRKTDTPFEYFLITLLPAHGVPIRQVLEYFHDQDAKDAIDVLLEFHKCDECTKTFGSVSTH